MQIEVVDEIMGSGKSYATLKYIEGLAENNQEERWIFCTEYLSEIEQRTKCCNLWKTPVDTSSSKLESFKGLLGEPDVQLIAITHSLLISSSVNTYVNYLITHRGYKLFLDETIDLINVYNGAKFGDFTKALRTGECKIDTDNFGKVVWITKDDTELTGGYDTSIDKIKVDSLKGFVYCALKPGSVGDTNSISLVEIVDDIIFKRFSRVIVATYQIDDSLFDAYLNIKNIGKTVCKDVVCSRTTTKNKIKSCITFIDKYNNTKNFIKETSLSSNWYKDSSNSDDYKLINKIIKYIGDNNGCKGNAKLLGFTVPSSKLGKQRDAKKIQPVGYPHTVCSVVVDEEGVSREEHSKSLSTYVPCNARASNEYAGKVVMIHAYNRYPIQPVLNFLIHYNVRFSSERFALNEIVQWVWRSAIRNGDNIKLAILSVRMRELFKTWLNKD